MEDKVMIGETPTRKSLISFFIDSFGFWDCWSSLYI